MYSTHMYLLHKDSKAEHRHYSTEGLLNHVIWAVTYLKLDYTPHVKKNLCACFLHIIAQYFLMAVFANTRALCT